MKIKVIKKIGIGQPVIFKTLISLNIRTNSQDEGNLASWQCSTSNIELAIWQCQIGKNGKVNVDLSLEKVDLMINKRHQIGNITKSET